MFRLRIVSAQRPFAPESSVQEFPGRGVKATVKTNRRGTQTLELSITDPAEFQEFCDWINELTCWLSADRNMEQTRFFSIMAASLQSAPNGVINVNDVITQHITPLLTPADRTKQVVYHSLCRLSEELQLGLTQQTLLAFFDC